MMKYEIEFMHKIQDGVPRNTVLVFGQDDIKGIAEKCFEYGQSGLYTSLKLTKVEKEPHSGDTFS